MSSQPNQAPSAATTTSLANVMLQFGAPQHGRTVRQQPQTEVEQQQQQSSEEEQQQQSEGEQQQGQASLPRQGTLEGPASGGEQPHLAGQTGARGARPQRQRQPTKQRGQKRDRGEVRNGAPKRRRVVSRGAVERPWQRDGTDVMSITQDNHPFHGITRLKESKSGKISAAQIQLPTSDGSRQNRFLPGCDTPAEAAVSWDLAAIWRCTQEGGNPESLDTGVEPSKALNFSYSRYEAILPRLEEVEDYVQLLDLVKELEGSGALEQLAKGCYEAAATPEDTCPPRPPAGAAPGGAPEGAAAAAAAAGLRLDPAGQAPVVQRQAAPPPADQPVFGAQTPLLDEEVAGDLVRGNLLTQDEVAMFNAWLICHRADAPNVIPWVKQLSEHGKHSEVAQYVRYVLHISSF